MKDFDSILEELDQTANGPELDQKADELDNEATEEREPETSAPDTSNEDVYPEDEHEQVEDVEGVVVKESESQTANGPELDQKAEELENEATEEREPETNSEECENACVYPDDEHEQVEDVEGVVVSEATKVTKELSKFHADVAADNKIIKDTGNKLSKTNNPAKREELGKIMDNSTKAIENRMEKLSPKASYAIGGSRHGTDDDAYFGGKDPGTAAYDKGKEAGKLIADAKNSSGLKKQILLRKAESIKKQGQKLKAEQKAQDEDYKDVSTQPKNGFAAFAKKHMPLKEEELFEDGILEDELETNPLDQLDKLDSEPAEKSDSGEEVEEFKAEEVVDDKPELKLDKIEDETVEEDIPIAESNFNSLFKLIDSINESISQTANGPELDQKAEELENEATEEKKPETNSEECENACVYPDDEHEQVEDVKPVVVKESASQTAADPELKPAKELEDQATVLKKPDIEKPELGNTDIYTDEQHQQVEDVVGIVVEAATLVKKEGKPVSKANIAAKLSSMLCPECQGITKDNKAFDIDRFLKSPVVSGKTHCDEKEEKGMTASVEYKSLKEACMLDEDYFDSDSVIIESADDKVNRLTEQVALLLARESMDPMYDELLKTASYAARLQENCIRKYAEAAQKRAAMITEDARRKHVKDNVVDKATTKYVYYTDPSDGTRRVKTITTVKDNVDGSEYKVRETDKEIKKYKTKGHPDYGTLRDDDNE